MTGVVSLVVVVVLPAIELLCKYVTKGWKEVHAAYADKENPKELARLLSYLEAVEKARHSCDEALVVHLIEEHGLEMEQLLTDHLKSKQVSSVFFFLTIIGFV